MNLNVQLKFFLFRIIMLYTCLKLHVPLQDIKHESGDLYFLLFIVMTLLIGGL